MRRLIYQSLVTLDGYVGGPGGELDWHLVTPEMHAVYNEAQRQIGGYLMGRKTYQVMRAWDELGGGPEDAAEYRDFHAHWIAVPKLVFSTTLSEVGFNASLARGDAPEIVRALKQTEGGPLALNGTALAASLLDSGLIDEFILFVHPVLLSGGTPLFRPGQRRLPLRLLEAKAYPPGIVRLHYAAGG